MTYKLLASKKYYELIDNMYSHNFADLVSAAVEAEEITAREVLALNNLHNIYVGVTHA